MLRFPVTILSAALVASAVLPGQTQPAAVPAGGPDIPRFFAEPTNALIVSTVEVRPESAMSREDQDLVANAESSIEERVRLDDIDFNQGKWTYQQIACTAFPNHLLVRFSRNEGANDVSMFSASIPRSNEGRLRIVPIYRKGYSLFSPATTGPRTIAAFNHIRSEEHYDKAPSWVATGLCYSALTGGKPDIGGDSSDTARGGSPILVVLKNGGAVIEFTDFVARSRPLAWALTFDHNGQLLKVERRPSPSTIAKAVPPPASNPEQHPIKPTKEIWRPVPSN